MSPSAFIASCTAGRSATRFFRNDLPVIVGVVIVTALVIAIVDFVRDVIQAMIDPRVKLQPQPA